MIGFHLLDHGSNRNALQTSKGHKFLSVQTRKARDRVNEQAESKNSIKDKHGFDTCRNNTPHANLMEKGQFQE
jgi:hypothetical protein